MQPSHPHTLTSRPQHAVNNASILAITLSTLTLDAEEAVCIPPPRPKRKPSHPYPKKDPDSAIATATATAGLSTSFGTACLPSGTLSFGTAPGCGTPQQLFAGMPHPLMAACGLGGDQLQQLTAAATLSGAEAAGTAAAAADDAASEGVNDATVAAVAAAASAAAAAAAAAVVSAAGSRVQAYLQAHPPAGFPFFGVPPGMLSAYTAHPDALACAPPPSSVAVAPPTPRSGAEEGLPWLAETAAAAAEAAVQGRAAGTEDAEATAAALPEVVMNEVEGIEVMEGAAADGMDASDGSGGSPRAASSDGDSACSREADPTASAGAAMAAAGQAAQLRAMMVAAGAFGGMPGAAAAAASGWGWNGGLAPWGMLNPAFYGMLGGEVWGIFLRGVCDWLQVLPDAALLPGAFEARCGLTQLHGEGARRMIPVALACLNCTTQP